MSEDWRGFYGAELVRHRPLNAWAREHLGLREGDELLSLHVDLDEREDYNEQGRIDSSSPAVQVRFLRDGAITPSGQTFASRVEGKEATEATDAAIKTLLTWIEKGEGR